MPHKMIEHIEQSPNGDDYREKLVAAEHGLRGDTVGITRIITMILALCWSLFQLASASILLLDTVYIRAIHLAFAISLVYFNIPMIKISGTSWRWDLRILLAMNRVTILDYLLGIIAAVSALYIVLDYEGIASRAGVPTTRDIIFGLMLVVLLPGHRPRPADHRQHIYPVRVYRAAPARFPCLQGRIPVPLHLPDDDGYGRHLRRAAARFGHRRLPLRAVRDNARTGRRRQFLHPARHQRARFRGGAAKAAVLGSALTGVVSGSSIANVVTTGTFTIPLMKKVGYPPEKAAAVEVASSINGQLAPPVMGAAAFIIAEYVNVPYIEVAKAAAIPAFAAYAGLLWITHVEACKLGLRGLSKSELPSFWTTLKEGLHFLIPICMLLYELIIMQHSAEMSVFRAIVVLALIMLGQPVVKAFVHKKSKRKALKEGIKTLLLSLSAGGSNMAGVAMATASAGIIVGCVSLGLGQQITSFVEILSGGNIFLLLLITALASLLLGMGLPTTANYIIMASLTAPILVQLASGIVVFGILADDTPPVGLAAYAAAAIADTSPIATGIQGFLYDIRTAILPLMFIFNHDIILWGVDSVPEGIFLFFMTVLGCMSFASLTQGWFIAKNTLPDALLLACSTIIMLYPALLTGFFLPHDQRYWGYLIGIGIMGLLAYMQHARTTQTTEAAA